MRTATSEQQIQRAVFAHIRQRAAAGVFAFHVPNGGYRKKTEAAILKGMGVVAGVPDVMIIWRGSVYGLELKTETGKPTAKQYEAVERIRDAGGFACICHGLDRAIKCLEMWGILRGAGRMSAPEWLFERTQHLRKLFAEGLSAGAIAAELGNTTRNAVIGKLGRLGLHLSRKRPGPPRARNSRKNRRAPWKPAIIEQNAPAPDIEPQNPVSLMQLEPHHCRWPVSGEGATTLFCGADKHDHAYCIHHVRMAYSRPMTPAERGLAMAKMRRARAA